MMICRTLAAFLAVAFLLSCFSGCINNENSNSKQTQITEPEQYVLEKLDLHGKKRIVLSEDCCQAVPILASVFKNHGIDVSVDWDNGDGVKLDASDASKFSSQVAITFWNHSMNAIVVDTYENALLASPLAAIIDAPVLYFGNTTNEVLWRIGATGADSIISIGNATHFAYAGVSLANQTEVLEYAISAAKEIGQDIDYAAIVKSRDDRTGEQDASYYSCMGAILATHRNGLLVATNGNSESAINEMRITRKLLEDNGMALKFVCVLGGYEAMEPGGWMSSADVWGSVGEDPCPSDNPYGDFDEDPITMECAVGRVIAINAESLSRYCDRIINYESYLSRKTVDDLPNPVQFGADWNNNALIYFGEATEYMTLGAETATAALFRNALFNTQDDSVKAHLGLSYIGAPLMSSTLLAEDYAKSNFIGILIDHGEPSACSVSAKDILPMPPSVVFAASCSLGQIDNVAKSASFTYQIIDKGAAAYFGPTRLAVGQVAELPDNPIYGYEAQGACGAGGLGYFVFKCMINENLTTGEALMKAKNLQVQQQRNPADSALNPEYQEETSWEYQLYGDPAFNPYEPCNEGRK